MEVSSRPPRIFICYHHPDAAKAEEIFTRLLEAGGDPWLDKRKLVLGDVWEAEIKSAVLRADVFIVLLSPGFNEIGFRQKEVNWAREALELRPPGRSFIIPFLLEPCEIPDWCRPFHAGPDNLNPSSIDDLLLAIEKHCNFLFDDSNLRKVSRMVEILPIAEAEERAAIAKSLGRLGKGSQRAVKALISMLRDLDQEVYLNAVASLGLLGPEALSAVPDLLATLDVRNPKARVCFAEAVGRIGIGATAAAPVLVEMIKTEKNGTTSLDTRGSAYWPAINALRAMKSSWAAERVADGLKDAEVETRILTAVILRDLRLSSKAVIEALCRVLDETDSVVGHYAAEALGAMGTEAAESIPILLAHLRVAPHYRQESIVKALGKMGPQASSAIPLLIELIRRRRGEYDRIDLIDALGRIGCDSGEVAELLILLLSEGNLKERCRVAVALGRSGGRAKQAVPAIIEILAECVQVVGDREGINENGLFDIFFVFEPSPAWALARIDPQSLRIRQAIRSAIDALESSVNGYHLRIDASRWLERLESGKEVTDDPQWWSADDEVE